jgi:hypothetical protein
MRIDQKYLIKYTPQMILDQVADQYKEEGYKIATETIVGDVRPDLVLQKGDDFVIVELKSGRSTDEMKEKLFRLHQFVNNNKNYKLVVALASPPEKKRIEIEGIEDILHEFIMRSMPDQLSTLATHVTVKSVSTPEFKELIISNNNVIYMVGSSVIDIEKQFGSDSDVNNNNGIVETDSFSFDFRMSVSFDENNKLQLSKYPPEIEVRL